MREALSLALIQLALRRERLVFYQNRTSNKQWLKLKTSTSVMAALGGFTSKEESERKALLHKTSQVAVRRLSGYVRRLGITVRQLFDKIDT